MDQAALNSPVTGRCTYLIDRQVFAEQQLADLCKNFKRTVHSKNNWLLFKSPLLNKKKDAFYVLLGASYPAYRMTVFGC
jgi:hypothetical protein